MRLRSLSSIIGFGGLAILSSASLLAQVQSERPQFRAGVELLQLDVVVLDSKRQPVSGLTAADFTVLDNGDETPIRAFTPIELARPRANEAVWAGDVAPDVVTNQISEEDGRLVVILMDRTIPQEQPTVTARTIATTAVQLLGPHDLAAVVSTNNSAVQTRAVQNLTVDRARLLDAINAADPSTGMSGTALGIMNPPQAPFKIDPLNDSRCLCGLCVLETITRVAEAVQGTPRRRKVLLFIGSSMIWQANRPIATAYQDPGCETRLKDARASCSRRSGVCVAIAAIRPEQHANEADYPPRIQAQRCRAWSASDLSGHAAHRRAGASRDARAHSRRQGHCAARSVAAVPGVLFRQSPDGLRDQPAARDAHPGRVPPQARRVG